MAFVVLLVVFGEAAMWGVFPVLVLVILAFALGMRESDRVWDKEEDRVARVLHQTDD
ncbi:MAG: hypothetical protein JST00_13820 [Deltaproteobacteria bacterium]|nr:hypothetical protein [Deltaproteobacteria bacterium]